MNRKAWAIWLPDRWGAYSNVAWTVSWREGNLRGNVFNHNHSLNTADFHFVWHIELALIVFLNHWFLQEMTLEIEYIRVVASKVKIPVHWSHLFMYKGWYSWIWWHYYKTWCLQDITWTQGVSGKCYSSEIWKQCLMFSLALGLCVASETTLSSIAPTYCIM